MKKKVVILGSGESGVGAALLAQSKKYAVFVSDKSEIKEKYRAELSVAKIEFEEKQHALDRILAANLIIKSPGIPEKAEVIQAARAKGIAGDEGTEDAGGAGEARQGARPAGAYCRPRC